MVRIQRSDETLVRQPRKKRGKRSGNSAGAVGQYASDAWSLAKRTAYGLNEIRKLINIETKVIQTTGTALTTGWGGAIYPVSYISQGTDYINNRIGNSLKLQRIECRVSFLKPVASQAINCRLMLVRDLDNMGAVPAVTDILETTGSALAPLSPINFLRKERFSILYDELFTVNTSGDNSHVSYFEMAHEGHIKYLGASALPASGGKGSLFLLVVPDDNVNLISHAFFIRVFFTDD